MRAFVLTALVVLAGCREGVGSRCSSTADCKSGLACILPIGGSPQTGGVCTDVHDMAVEVDFSIAHTDDGGSTVDGSSTEDLATSVDADIDTDGGVL